MAVLLEVNDGCYNDTAIGGSEGGVLTPDNNILRSNHQSTRL